MFTFNVRRAIVALSAAGALLVTALAAAPQAEAKTIYACVKKKGGAVRILSAKTKCKKGESNISWNTSGPAGAIGLPGVKGATGATGATGPTGPMGPGATKASLFEVPKAGDAEHKVLESGPLRLGISCQSTATLNEIRFTLFVSFPEVPTTLDAEGSWVTTTKPISAPEERTLKPGEKEAFAGFLLLTGPNGVPELLYFAYGARTEEEAGAESVAPKGCWLQAVEL